MLTLGVNAVELPVFGETGTSGTWSLTLDKKSLLASTSLPHRITHCTARHCSNCR